MIGTILRWLPTLPDGKRLRTVLFHGKQFHVSARSRLRGEPTAWSLQRCGYSLSGEQHP